MANNCARMSLVCVYHWSQGEGLRRTLSRVHLLRNKDRSLGIGNMFCVDGENQISGKVVTVINTTLSMGCTVPP